MSEIIVIGIGVHGLTTQQSAALDACALIIGHKNHLERVRDGNAVKIPIPPLAGMMETIKKHLPSGRVAVLASGDPLFYGIGRKLLERFDHNQVTILPALSFVQEACARFKLPWDDAEVVSLHGRTAEHPSGILLQHAKTIVFTDAKNSPPILARTILQYLDLIDDTTIRENCRAHVAENLGRDDERVFSGTLEELSEQEFDSPNILILDRGQETYPTDLGLTENEIAHTRGLITKDEVRAATIHRLRLPERGILWDIGAGSGSVSVEAARLRPGLTVYAVEQDQTELCNIKKNIRRFGSFNIVPVEGEAPAALHTLPGPDRVFVGGSSGMLAGITAEAAARLPADGRLVVNAVLKKTADLAPRTMVDHGFSIEISRIHVERTSFPSEEGKQHSFNPITIITGQK